jgi:geranylgeranyl reductase family protein
MNTYDVIIVGAGPGGSTAALELWLKGINCLLVDKEHVPRDKTCGDALSGKSRKILKELGLDKKIMKAPHKIITGITFSSPNGAEAHIEFKDDKGNIVPGFICRRKILDNIIFQEAKKKVDTLEGFAVNDVIFENDKVTGVKGVINGKEKIIKSRVVIGAGGVYSIVARKVNAFENIPEHMCTAGMAYYKNVKGLDQDIELHFIDKIMPGYFWVFPCDNGLANVGVGIVDKEIKKHKKPLPELMEDVIHTNPKFKQRFRDAEKVTNIKAWKLSFGSKRRKSFGNGWLLIGDAAALVDPFTGEGMGNAIYSAKLAANVIANVKDHGWDMTMLNEYENLLKEKLDPELQQSYKMQLWGRNKWLVNYIIDRAEKSKLVREYVASSIISTDAKKQYFNPLFYFKLLFM